MKANEIAMCMMKAIVYDNDFVNRYEPENPDRLYKPYLPEIARILEPAVDMLGESFFTEEWCENFALGEESEIEMWCKLYPCLIQVNRILNWYYERLSD